MADNKSPFQIKSREDDEVRRNKERLATEVQISENEQGKGDYDRTRFVFDPKNNRLDKALVEIQTIIGQPIYITSGDRSQYEYDKTEEYWEWRNGPDYAKYKKSTDYKDWVKKGRKGNEPAPYIRGASTVNHNVEQKARDVGKASNGHLTQEQWGTIAKELAFRGFRIGDAWNTDEPHLHIDAYKAFSTTKTGTKRGDYIFTEGKKKEASFLTTYAKLGWADNKREWEAKQWLSGNNNTIQQYEGYQGGIEALRAKKFLSKEHLTLEDHKELEEDMKDYKSGTVFVDLDDDEMSTLTANKEREVYANNTLAQDNSENIIDDFELDDSTQQREALDPTAEESTRRLDAFTVLEANRPSAIDNAMQSTLDFFISPAGGADMIPQEDGTDNIQPLENNVAKTQSAPQDVSFEQGAGAMDIDGPIPVKKADKEPVASDFEGTAIPTMDLGAKRRDHTTMFQNLQDFTVEGMGDDLVNNFVDRGAVGFLTHGIIRNLENKGDFTPDWKITEDDLYEELTKGLDNEDLEEVLNNSFSRHDLIINGTLAQARMKRARDMEDYARNHPVLSGANVVANIFAEGAIFMPVSTIASAGLGATKIKRANDLVRASRLTKYAVGEVLEQGLQEIIWSQNQKEYEFDPLLFATSIGVGVGLKQFFGSAEADKAFRDFLKDEDGFINVATESGKKLVDEVTKRVGSKQAIALAEKITKKKTAVANSLRKELKAKRSAITKSLTKVNRQIKEAKKDKELLKKLKGKKQRLTRKLNNFDKKLPLELELLAKGTHPKLSAEVSPTLKITEIAQELGIDDKLINTPKKIRKFLGLDSPKADPDFIIEGEKAYESVYRTQAREMKKNRRLNANETLKYIAGTDTVKTIDKLPLLGRLQVGDKLRALAETDGPVSRFLFNKGNLVSSDNPLVSTFYNWLAPDGMGRQGMSKIRAIESQQKYANIYGGDLMNIYHTHGDRLYKLLEGDKLSTKAKAFFSPDSFEETVEPLLKERLLLGPEGFRIKYGDALADVADDFADDFNKLNKKINDRAKEVGVEGVNFDATDDWFHRSWDFRKARAVDEDDLSDTVFRAMKSHTEKLGLEKIDEEAMLAHAKKFAYGLRNADMSTIEGLQSDHIKLLTKLLKKADGTEAKVIKDEISRLKMLKAKADAGDLANRVQMDVNQTMKNGMKLSELFEDNIIQTQKKYTARMSARIAGAEHGIKNLDTLDDWVNDAVELEVKRLAEKGVKSPKDKIKFIKEAMTQDLNSFRNGGMVGLHDLPDDSANDLLRLVKKYNYARLMQYTGISSIAELQGTFVEAGVSTTTGEMGRFLRQHFNDLYHDNPEKYVDRLYDELRSITGVGMEDFSFSTKGMSKATRIMEEGVANTFEKGVDSLGRLAHGPFGGIEKVGRRITANALAIKWANHAMGTEKGGLLSAFFGSNGVTNRVLENSGFGKMTKTGKFVPNKTYKDVMKSIKKFATFDEKGNLVKLNLEKWDSNTAHAFGDAIQMQSNHIMVNPDSTTMALWQSTTVGQILNQFRTFTVNATTKVMGQTFANVAISSNRGDQAEMIKAGQKIFWGTSLGIVSVALRQGIQRAGGDREVDLFDEGLIKASAIGFSRSSIAGNIPTIADSISGSFGFDPIFDKTSSVGRSKNFFNLTTTPTGQAVHGVYQSVEKGAQGDFKGAGMKLLKTSPVYRQIGAQQLFNYIDDEK